ncbi:hypothetical protein LTR97_006409 [Elasticomyces elasticus]|uniref:Uncharacterized protein n=1 Tax=Elasticomyces elasticus TaxID=574655 RepID=A0AAN7VRV0_9PEZI|nr:hypothetical protein LTR97_006409 [Elasticomyces elasticus]
MAPRNQRKEIAQQLECDSRKIVAAFTEHKLLNDEITAIMHPGLVTWFDGLPNATSAAEHVHNLDTLSMGHPNWEVHVVNGCASARNGYGTVWLTINITGIPDKGFENMQREAADMTACARLYWKLPIGAVNSGLAVNRHFERDDESSAKTRGTPQVALPRAQQNDCPTRAISSLKVFILVPGQSHAKLELGCLGRDGSKDDIAALGHTMREENDNDFDSSRVCKPTSPSMALSRSHGDASSA